MEINLDNEMAEKIKNYTMDKQNEDYNKFYKNENLKISLINIDSSYRTKVPKNIYSASVSYLPKNPITLTTDSSIIQVNYPNHNLSINDKIIVQNVTGYTYVVSGGIYLYNNFNYCVIRIKHYYNRKYTTLLHKPSITISIVDNNSINDTLSYGNIPLNSIIGTFNIVLPSIANITQPIPDSILSNLSVSSAEELDKNYILIQLPYDYYSLSNSVFEITDFFKLSLLDLNGIPLNGINADYPINYERLQGYHQVYQVIDQNNFTINTNYFSISDGVSGGAKIQIMKISNTEEAYPDANNYTIKLKKNFNNVVRLELLSTEIPFIDYLIKSSGPNKNNKIYWQQLDDGTHIYSSEIPEGNYDGNTLFSLLQTQMNSVQRIQSTNENLLYNNFTISVNRYTQEVVFTAFKTESIPNSLRVDIVEINSIKYFRLTIIQPNNLVEVGDIITLTNASDIGIISSNTINTKLQVYEVNKNNSSYTILIGQIRTLATSTNLTDTITGDGGGITTVTTRANVSLLFNYSDTIGKVIGFRNAGQPNAITPFKSVISNFDNYIIDARLNSIGSVDNNNLILNLTGIPNYFLLYINDFELIQNNSSQLPCFAKILLSGLPGDFLYNTFVNFPLEFDFPISTLNELQIKIKYSDGTYPDFRNIDHSFTLKITEMVNYPRNTGINSKKINYLETMKEIANHPNESTYSLN
jgi:hypothetical protein